MIADLNYSEMLYHHLEHWYVSPAVAILQESTHFNGGGARCINMFKFEEQLQFRIYIIPALYSVEDFQWIFCRDAFSTQFLSYVILLLYQE